MDIFTPQKDQGGDNVDPGRNDTSPTGALATNTSIASVAIANNHIRVYFQDTDGYLGQSECRDGAWTAGVRINTAFQAKPNTPLAAVTYSIYNSSWDAYDLSVRLYYVDMNNMLREHCWQCTAGANQWSTGNGALGGERIEVDYRSKIAACVGVVSQSPCLRVYYQAPYEHGICEICWFDEGYGSGAAWGKNASCPWVSESALLGTGLAALWLLNNSTVTIFYQSASDGMVLELWISTNNDSWRGGDLPSATTLGQAVSGTAIAAITWSSSLTNRQFRVYYQHSNGVIVENGYGMDNVQEYSGPRHLAESLKGTSLSASCFSSGTTTHTRVYLEQQRGSILEYCGIGGWAKGGVVRISR